MHTQLRRTAQLMLIPVLLVLSGCENKNLFSKLSGTSSDPQTLNEQAAIALRERDYSKALELANKVLSQDPNNSDALYARASANMGLTGVNLATLVSNVLDHTSSSSLAAMNGLPGLVSASRESVHSMDDCGGAGSLIEGINCAALNAVIDSVISDLRKIASGSALGKISALDTVMLIDYGVARILRAAVRAANGGFLDFKNVNGNFSVTTGPNLSNLCSTNASDALAIVRDVGAAYGIFNRVVVRLNLSNNSIVARIRNDIQEVGDDVFTDDGSLLPHVCFTNVFDAYSPALNKSNYRDVFNSEAFSLL